MWISDSQIDRSTRRGLTALLFNGVCGFTWDALASGGPFLVAFAVAAGADNFMLGLIGAVPWMAQVFQVPAVIWLERWRRPKRMLFTVGPISRGLWVSLALVPLFFVGKPAVYVLAAVLFLASSTGAFLGVAWSTWVRLLVPDRIMGRYFGYRQRVSLGFAVLVGLLAGFFVDWWKRAYPEQTLIPYAFVLGLGGLFAVLSLMFMYRVPARDLPPAHEGASTLNVLKEPFLDRNYRSLLLFMFLWVFGTSLAVPFMAAYLLRRLGFPVSTVVIFTTIQQVSYVLFVNAWGRLADAVGNRAVLYFCGLLQVLVLAALPFSAVVHHQGLLISFLVGLYVVGGLALGGVNLASSNMAYRFSPPGSAHTYLAAHGLVASAAGAVAPLLAGLLADFFAVRHFAVRVSWSSPAREWETDIVNLQGLDFVFLVAAVVAAFALHRLAFVREGATAKRLGMEQVAQELSREVRGVTSLGGLRSLVTFPFTLTALARRTLMEPAEEAQQTPRPGAKPRT